MERHWKHLAKSSRNFQPYVGSFSFGTKDYDKTVVIALACGKLTATPWGSADMPICMVPHNFSSSKFPPGLFPIGTCYPRPDVDVKAEEGVTHMNFTQEDGMINRFT